MSVSDLRFFGAHSEKGAQSRWRKKSVKNILGQPLAPTWPRHGPNMARFALKQPPTDIYPPPRMARAETDKTGPNRGEKSLEQTLLGWFKIERLFIVFCETVVKNMPSGRWEKKFVLGPAAGGEKSSKGGGRLVAKKVFN